MGFLNTISWLDVISWAAGICLLYGIKLIGDKKSTGFFFGIVGEIVWIVWALFTPHSSALIMMSLAFIMMYVRGVVMWRKDEKCKS